MLKDVNSKIAILGSRFLYYFKLVFDSKQISGFRKFLNVNFARTHFLKGFKMEKTANLNQNCPRKAIRNFCNFDRRCFKQKRL